MESRISKKWAKRVFSVFLAATVMGCGNKGESGKTQDSNTFETTRAYVQSWLSEVDADELIISSSFLKQRIVDDWDNRKGQYQIVSVRKPEDYTKTGHIPHATNVYWVDTVTDESLARLDSTKTLVLYCYYGHGSMISSTILNLLGYRCYSLDFGMMAWNLGALVKQPWDRQADYEVESTVNRPKYSYSTPVIASSQTDARNIIMEMAKKYFSEEASPVIRPADVKAILDDWDNKKVEYQVIDVRSKRDYEKGHVPHSMNIPWAEIVEIENLTKLDPRRTIIICSANGQTGQLATTALNLLGYQAINMLFGMMDWNKAYVDSDDQWDGSADYPIERT